MSNVVNDGKKGMAWTRTRNFLAGYSSGVCLVLAGHPFDTIKVSSMQIIRGVGVEKTSSLPAHETPTYQRTVAFGNAYIQLAAAVCAGWFERRLFHCTPESTSFCGARAYQLLCFTTTDDAAPHPVFAFDSFAAVCTRRCRSGCKRKAQGVCSFVCRPGRPWLPFLSFLKIELSSGWAYN